MAARIKKHDYLSKEWSEKRKEILLLWNGKCAIDFDGKFCNGPIHIHHRKYGEQLGNEDSTWLIPLCEFHHEAITNANHKAKNSSRQPTLNDVKTLLPTYKEIIKKDEKPSPQDYRSITVPYAQRTDS